MNKLTNIPLFLLSSSVTVIRNNGFSGDGEQLEDSREIIKVRLINKSTERFKSKEGIEELAEGVFYINGDLTIDIDDNVEIDSQVYQVKKIYKPLNPDSSVHHTKVVFK